MANTNKIKLPDSLNRSREKIILKVIYFLLTLLIGWIGSAYFNNLSNKEVDNNIIDEVQENLPEIEIINTTYDSVAEELIHTIKNTGEKEVVFEGYGEPVLSFLHIKNSKGIIIPFELPRNKLVPGEEMQILISLKGEKGEITSELGCEYSGNKKTNGEIPCTPKTSIINHSFQKPSYSGLIVVGVDATFQDCDKGKEGEKCDDVTLHPVRKILEDQGVNFFTLQSSGYKKNFGAVTVGTEKLLPGNKNIFLFFREGISLDIIDAMSDEIKSVYPHLDDIKKHSFTELTSSLAELTNPVKSIMYYVGDCSTEEFGYCNLDLTGKQQLFSKKMLDDDNNNIDIFFIVPATSEVVKTKE